MLTWDDYRELAARCIELADESSEPSVATSTHARELVLLETKPVWSQYNTSEFFYASQTFGRIELHAVACTHQIGGLP